MPNQPTSPDAPKVIPGNVDQGRRRGKVELTPGEATATATKVRIAGLLVKESQVTPTKLAKSTIQLWDEEPQKILLYSLKRFLPKVTAAQFDKKTPVRVFQLFASKAVPTAATVARAKKVEPKEMEQCARSHRLYRWDRIPDTELTALKAACEELRKRQGATGAPDHTVKIMQTLRFPDPVVDPDLYRVYGRPWNRKLAVLWGFEFAHEGKTPEDALELLKGWTTKPSIIRGVWLSLVVVAAVALGALAYIPYAAYTKVERDNRMKALQQIDALVADSQQLSGDASKTLARVQQEFSSDQVIEVRGNVERLDTSVGGLEGRLKGFPEFKEVAERLQTARYNASKAKGDLGIATRTVDDKVKAEAILLGQTLQTTGEKFQNAIEIYAKETAMTREEPLRKLDLAAAITAANNAIATAKTLVQRHWLPEKEQQQLEGTLATTEQRLKAYDNIPKGKGLKPL